MLRWLAAIAFTLAALLVSTISANPHYSTLADSGSTGGTGGTGGFGPEPVLLGFSDSNGEPVDSIDSVPVGEVVELYVAASGLLAGEDDTIQLLAGSDPATVAVIGLECAGLFDGAFSPDAPVEIPGQGTAIACGLESGVEGPSGVVANISLLRNSDTETMVTLLLEGPFGSRVFNDGVSRSVEVRGPLEITIPDDPAPAPAPGEGGGAPPAQPDSAPAVFSAPGAPGVPVAEAGDRRIEVSWQPPIESGGLPINSYEVRSADGSTSAVVDGEQRSALLLGRENGVQQRFRVRAVNSIAAGPFSPLSEPVVPAGLPSAPLDVIARVTAGSTGLSLSWSPPLNSNGAAITGYMVREAGGLFEAVHLGAGALSTLLTGLNPGEYTLVLTAMNAVGEGASTNLTVEIPRPPGSQDTLSPGAASSSSLDKPANRQSEALRQLGLLFGDSIEMGEGAPVYSASSGNLLVSLPVMLHAQRSGAASRVGGFTGFTLGSITVEGVDGEPATARIESGGSVVLTGEAEIRERDGQVTVVVSEPVLSLFAPESESGPTKLFSSPAFELPVNGLTGLPEFAMRHDPVIGAPVFPAVEELEALLEKAGMEAAGLTAAGDEIEGIAVLVLDRNDASFTPGPTLFSFSIAHPEPGAIHAAKLADDGTLHLAPVECSGPIAGVQRCSALFTGQAAGFSTFAAFEVRPVEVIEPRQDPAAQVGSAPPASPSSPSVQPGLSAAAPGDLTPTTPGPGLPTPFPPATPRALPGADARVDDGSAAMSVVVIGGIAVAGLVALLGLGRLLVYRRPGPPVAILVLAVASAAALSGPFQPIALAVPHAAGTVESEGDVAQRSDLARSLHGTDGSEVTVGIISDSFGCDTAALDADVASGEVPSPSDMALHQDAGDLLCPLLSDRGRAMAQLIMDVAPGVEMMFASAVSGQSMVARIALMAGAGADIIVDDVSFGTEAVYRDGAIARAVDDAVSEGILYITAAGGTVSAAHESEMFPSGVAPISCPPPGSGPCTRAGIHHDFDPGAGVDHLLEISIPPGQDLNPGEATISLHWDDLDAEVNGVGPETDLDLYIVDEIGVLVASGASDNDGAGVGSPVESVRVTGETVVSAIVSHHSGPLPGRFRLLVDGGDMTDGQAIEASTIVGHRNSAGAITVGPVNFEQAPAFGGSPVAESGAPAGGSEILFDGAGSRLTVPVVRQKPDIAAPSGTITTLGVVDGSSAAAAHAAGAAALLLQQWAARFPASPLEPGQVRWLLSSTAVDADPPGADTKTGLGLIDTLAAADLLGMEPPSAVADAWSVDMNGSLDVEPGGVLSNDSDTAGHAMEAELITGPASGTLVLRPDGSFTYTPELGFVGDVEFVYVASDGAFASAPAEVTISVQPIERLSTTVTLQSVGPMSKFGDDLIEATASVGAESRTATLTPGGEGEIVMERLQPGGATLTVSAPGFLQASAAIVLGTVAGAVVEIPPLVLLAGDADGDGDIGAADALEVSASHGIVHAEGDRTVAGGDTTDFNGDSVTNGMDLSLAVSNIGASYPPPWGG